MFNPMKKRTARPLVRKAVFAVPIVLLVAPVMLVLGQKSAGGLRHYYSKESKVGFRYPAGWKLEPGDGSIAGDQFSRMVTVSLPDKSYPRTNFVEANATLAVGSVSEAACKEFQPDRQADAPKPRKMIIGNLMYYTVSDEEVAAGSVYQTDGYRTFHDGKCYEVNLVLHTGNMGAYDPGTVRRVNDKMVFNLLKTIVRTLYFGK